MVKHNRKCSILTGMVLFLLLTAFTLAVIRRMDPEIFQVLRTVPLSWVLILVFLDCLYQLMEAVICQTILKGRLLPFRHSLDVTCIGVFAGVAAPFGGKAPMQSLYLHHRGLMPGIGMGLMSVEYLLHKTAVLLYATCTLLIDWRWIYQTLPSLSPYLLFAYSICIIIILSILLVCTWHRIKKAALWLIGKIPGKGKWTARKARWTENIEVLYQETQALMQNKKRLLSIFLLETVKLTMLYLIPVLSVRILGIRQIGRFHILGLTAIMFMLSNALPNISGMGAIEFSFFLIFSGIFGELTLTALLLYRIASYYIPFFISCIWFSYLYYRYLKRL